MPDTRTSASALRDLATRLTPWREQFPAVAVTTVVLVGRLADTLATVCTRPDLLALGHHRDGSPAADVLDVLGPRITSAMHAVRCPTAVVPEAKSVQAPEPDMAARAT